MADKIEKDPLSGNYTTGHTWNGIRELRTPIPQWWLGTWLVSIIFSIGYVWVLPAIPTIDGASGGSSEYTARLDLEASMERAAEAQASLRQQVAETELADIASNPDLARFAFNGGAAAYRVNCIACHGSGANGQLGQFPSLIDDDWLWGGTLDEVHHTIINGIRNVDYDEARFSEMPAYDWLEPGEPEALADVVLALNENSENHSTVAELPGYELYQDNCAACHGEAGNGNHDLGAPKLNDAIWLYGGAKENVVSQIIQPKNGVMPGFGERLPEDTLKMLAFYIHSLGGGEQESEETASLKAE